jgi:hypothetical protein
MTEIENSNPKIHMKTQKTPSNQSKKQSWSKRAMLQVSQYSHYTTEP